MTAILGSALLILQLPPPPGTDAGNGDSEWWRILAVLIVTVLTVGLFAWIFKPTPAVGPVLTPPEISPPGPDTGEQLNAGNLVPFRERSSTPSISETDFTTAAATERLRRLTSREQPPGTPPQERRRLGGKRPPGPNPLTASDPPTSSFPPSHSTTPGIEPEEETTVEPNQTDVTTSIDDLLGDFANQETSEEAKPYETMRGDALTERELRQLTTDVPTGSNILPFTPRAPKPSDIVPIPITDEYEEILAGATTDLTAPTPIPIDVSTREGISATIQELLFCANVGELMHGFALYTDRYLFQFMTESGFDEDSFRETFSAMPGKEPQDWTRVESIAATRRLDDGRVTADITYLEQGKPVAPERFTFKLDLITGRWLIDGIAPVST